MQAKVKVSFTKKLCKDVRVPYVKVTAKGSPSGTATTTIVT